MKNRPTTARGRPRQFSTDAALDAAVRVFWVKGYAGASISDLCAATGLAPPSLYGAFGSKRGIFLAALDRYARTLGLGPVRAMESAAPEDKASALAEAATALCFPDGKPHGCLIACIAPAAAAEDDVIRDHLRELMRESATILQAARGAADLPDGELLLAAMHAGAVRARSGSSPEEVRRLVERLVAPH